MVYKLVNDYEEIEILLEDIFTEINMRKRMKDVLQNFSLKEGCVVERKAILFKNDLDENDLAQFKIPLDDYHVLIEIDSIASTINEDSQAYLTFEEFYSYLERNIGKYIVQEDEKSALLISVKQGLGI
ncbi:hypothetical protein [Lysinibacillus odysseyi]|uniref:Uncharacterized protein n=1 Tax=Lysinibacillus odysseyi 34hs-1 = NBRC 100172 TaxID=1220589 RepID=A0A0A3JE76_9BACI|nr:hypothetical protein [Lysinibacillus odysseyi]KGR85312.1 hypothetical protein CD32_08690 [Lysinibacillus odysseyi 34hs-1 = NBRC 100172]